VCEGTRARVHVCARFCVWDHVFICMCLQSFFQELQMYCFYMYYMYIYVFFLRGGTRACEVFRRASARVRVRVRALARESVGAC